ncbi:uncharacterized protein LOC143281409 [Babylonia areolata]|uniref:uncharacterized protein LOC143281409 n=1 Tax=Babylonia areolata TaxID=304850 RepID=UPI003FD43FB1
MIYNRTALSRVMPRDTFYCAIVRRPLSRFLSSARYYRHLLPEQVRRFLFPQQAEGTGNATGGSGNASTIPRNASTTSGNASTIPRNAATTSGNASDISNQTVQGVAHTLILPRPPPPPLSLAEVVKGKIKERMEHVVEIYNTAAWDSGLPVQQHMNQTAVKEHIDKLDRELDLVMVMERFHDSVVLLKRRTCLQMKDILHFQLNSGGNRLRLHLTESDKDFLGNWQMADNMIYEHFYRKFEAEVEREGDSFRQEVRYFRTVLDRVEKYCSNLTLRRNDVLVVNASPWHQHFTVDDQDCALMEMSELRFQRLLIKRAREQLREGRTIAQKQG